MSSLQLLNVIQSTPKTEAKGLLYVDVTINGKATKATLDTGVSHNFVSVDEVSRLGLKATGGGGSIKAVNSAARPIHRVARGVRANLGAWSGHVDFSMVPMDDFKVVLGLEFLDLLKAIQVPFTNNMCIMDGNTTCVVPTARSTKQETKVLATLEFKKGVRRDKESNFAILSEYEDREVKPNMVEPKEVAAVL